MVQKKKLQIICICFSISMQVGLLYLITKRSSNKFLFSKSDFYFYTILCISFYFVIVSFIFIYIILHNINIYDYIYYIGAPTGGPESTGGGLLLFYQVGHRQVVLVRIMTQEQLLVLQVEVVEQNLKLKDH